MEDLMKKVGRLELLHPSYRKDGLMMARATMSVSQFTFVNGNGTVNSEGMSIALVGTGKTYNEAIADLIKSVDLFKQVKKNQRGK